MTVEDGGMYIGVVDGMYNITIFRIRRLKWVDMIAQMYEAAFPTQSIVK
jgi:hypothetical protein